MNNEGHKKRVEMARKVHGVSEQRTKDNTRESLARKFHFWDLNRDQRSQAQEMRKNVNHCNFHWSPGFGDVNEKWICKFTFSLRGLPGPVYFVSKLMRSWISEWNREENENKRRRDGDEKNWWYPKVRQRKKKQGVWGKSVLVSMNLKQPRTMPEGYLLSDHLCPSTRALGCT